MTLIRAESARLLTRRLTLVLLVLLTTASAATVATVAVSTHPPATAEVAAAERQAAAQRDRLQAQYTQCLVERRPEMGPHCERVHPDRVDVGDHLPGVFVFSRSARPLLHLLATFLALFGFLVGASFVGAELTSGGMANLLLRRPERGTVLGAKLAVLVGGMLALGVAATAAYLGAFWTLARVAGLPGDTSGRFWADLSGVAGRGLALALAAAAVGFGLAVLGRRTSAATGALAAYAVAWEVGGRIVLDVNGLPADHGVWFLSSHLASWVSGQVTVREWPADPVILTWPQSGTVLAILVAVTLACAAVAFRRRDVT